MKLKPPVINLELSVEEATWLFYILNDMNCGWDNDPATFSNKILRKLAGEDE